MRKLGPTHFRVDLGEQVKLRVSSIKEEDSSINVEDLIRAVLDGLEIQPNGADSEGATYEFTITKPIGKSHELSFFFEPDVADVAFEIELPEADEPLHHVSVKRQGGESPFGKVFTFSTHGSGGGTKG